MGIVKVKITLPDNWKTVAGLTEAKETKLTCHISKKKMGQLGDIIVVKGDDCDAIAEILGLDANWKLKDVGRGWGAYDGDSLTFFQHKGDFDSVGPDVSTLPLGKRGIMK